MAILQPKFSTLYEEIETRIQKFYENGSILTENKYIVGFYGENVKKAFDKMKRSAGNRLSAEESTAQFRTRKNGSIIADNTYSKMFWWWASTFIPDWSDSDTKEVELRWTASNVVIPSVKPTTVKDFAMDSTKTLWYPLITGNQATDKIILTVVEERGMGMYQFFNALTNTFFTTQLLKPKSSFQKLAMYIIILNGEYVTSNHTLIDVDTSIHRTESIMDIPLQIFEFNSIVPLGVSPLTFKQGDNNDKVTFTVEFEAPNIFQGSYASTSVRGLRDNSTSANFLDGVTDSGALSGNGYDEDAFTLVNLMDVHNVGKDFSE